MTNRLDTLLPRLLERLGQGLLADDEVELVNTLLAREGLESCPPWLLARASRLAQSPVVPQQARESLTVRGLRLARLVFDSWSSPQPAFLRGAALAPRQIVLQCGPVDISLHVAGLESADLMVIGQVLGQPATGGQALLRLADSDQLASAPVAVAIDPIGEFVFDSVLPGRYILSLQISESTIDSPPLDIRRTED